MLPIVSRRAFPEVTAFNISGVRRTDITDPQKLTGRALSGELLARFAKVKYMSEDHVETIDSVINISGVMRWVQRDAATSFAETILESRSPFIKDSRFSEEEEWRLAFTVPVLKRKPVMFRPGRCG
jgi:hypothetical protein